MSTRPGKSMIILSMLIRAPQKLIVASVRTHRSPGAKIAVLELKAPISVAHRSQDEHDEENADQDGKEPGCQRQVVYGSSTKETPVRLPILVRPVKHRRNAAGCRQRPTA